MTTVSPPRVFFATPELQCTDHVSGWPVTGIHRPDAVAAAIPTALDEEDDMTTVDEQIDVDRPISTVYNQWTQFEDFPRFMEGVESVRQLDDVQLHWKASIGGVEREWDAMIVDQEPDRVISWQNTTGATNRGVVTFTPLGPEQTRIDLHLEFEPDGAVEQVGDKLGMVSRRAKGDLERFKGFIEGRGVETGEWRGSIDAGVERR